MESVFIPGPTSVIHPGDVVDGRYRVVSVIAHGGMGTVFLAEHVLIRRRVALKVLHPELAGDRAMIQRFMNEASAAGTLGHPHIVESTDMGFTPEGVPFIVFELLEGTLLTDEVYRVRGLAPRRALRIACQIASALDAAHSAGIVHLDLKSDNIMLVDREGGADHVKVLDFGIARFVAAEAEPAQRGLAMGTPEFMAPEQLTAPETVDARTDVWALGVVMYEMLTARRPYSLNEGSRLMFHRILHELPPPMNRRGVCEALERTVLDRMLARDPAQRFSSMRECAMALETLLREADAAASSPSLPAPIAAAAPAVVEEPERRRPSDGYRHPPAPVRRWPVGVLALALVAAAGGGGLLYAEQKMIRSIDDAALHELERNAGQLAGQLAAAARTVTERGEALATSPVLRSAIDTDRATIDDVLEAERLLEPTGGETIEVFHGTGETAQLVLRSPADAPAIGAAPVTVERGVLQVATRVPIHDAAGEPSGSIVVRTPLDLGPLRGRLSRVVLGATVTGLPAPLVLVPPAADLPDAIELAIPVAVPTGLGIGALTLRAELRPTARGQSLRTARYGAWGAAGALLFGFVAIGAAGGRRRRRRVELVPASA
jgi:serine/threonine-protein kinase